MPPSPAHTARGILCLCIAAAVLALAGAASAVPLEAKDIAAERADRKRAARQGKLPLPGTPDLALLDERLAKKGLPADSAIFIRIFKAESELEVWMSRESGATFTHFATYPICYWSGKLGPKLKEGDRQAPEGFYTVTLPQTYHSGRWPRSLNIGFPNPFDKVHVRSGSHILIHGGCASIGCFAMTNAVNLELHKLTVRAVDSGQAYVHVHVFPFRMTNENLAHYDTPAWHDFWHNLKQGYDIFERTHRPPRISVCEGHYGFTASSRLEAANPGPIDVCPNTELAIEELAVINSRSVERTGPLPSDVQSTIALATAYLSRPQRVYQTRHAANALRQITPKPLPPGTSALLTRHLRCSLAIAGCRKYAALREALVSEASRQWQARIKTSSK